MPEDDTRQSSAPSSSRIFSSAARVVGLPYRPYSYEPYRPSWYAISSAVSTNVYVAVCTMGVVSESAGTGGWEAEGRRRWDAHGRRCGLRRQQLALPACAWRMAGYQLERQVAAAASGRRRQRELRCRRRHASPAIARNRRPLPSHPIPVACPPSRRRARPWWPGWSPPAGRALAGWPRWWARHSPRPPRTQPAPCAAAGPPPGQACCRGCCAAASRAADAALACSGGCTCAAGSPRSDRAEPCCCRRTGARVEAPTERWWRGGGGAAVPIVCPASGGPPDTPLPSASWGDDSRAEAHGGAAWSALLAGPLPAPLGLQHCHKQGGGVQGACGPWQY